MPPTLNHQHILAAALASAVLAYFFAPPSMLNRLKSLVSTTTPYSESPDPQKSTSGPALPLPSAKHLEDLRSEIPTACSSCESCEDEGEEHDESEFPELPRKFDVDLSSEMLGSVKPMHRLAIISTSKTDWPHDPSSDSSSLAYHLSSIHQRKVIRASAAKEIKEGPKKPVEIPGVYETSETSKLTVLASSLEVEEESGRSSSLLFPDFKYISSIPISKSGASAFYNQALDPAVGPLGLPASAPLSTDEEQLQSWVLPYRAVILLCSHKTRDKKCGIAAPLLQTVLCNTLTLHGQTVDTTGEALHHLRPSEELSTLSTDAEVQNLLRNVAGKGEGGRGGSNEVLISKISHLGGHRYAGVMIICFPSGTILYYGRVRPRDCVAIVEKTILKGEVLPEHLRGGGNLRREKGRSLLDW